MATQIKDKVKQLLTEYPILRESRRYIQARLWQEQALEQGLESVDDFLRAYANGDIANAESIRRSAAKLQAEKPELKPSKITQDRNDLLNQIIRKKKGDI
jgi:hypothetical protein